MEWENYLVPLAIACIIIGAFLLTQTQFNSNTVEQNINVQNEWTKLDFCDTVEECKQIFINRVGVSEENLDKYVEFRCDESGCWARNK